MYICTYSQISYYSLAVVFHIFNYNAATLMYIWPPSVTLATIGTKTQISRLSACPIVC